MAKDPYKYFRIEARELLQGMSQGILELEKGGERAQLTAQLLRCAHTLKGAARVVKQVEIAKLAHAMEDVVASYRDASAPIPHEPVDELLRISDAIAAELSSLDVPKEVRPAVASSTIVDGPLEAVRVEIRELDNLFEGISEVGMELSVLQSDLDEVEKTRLLAKRLTEQISKRRGTGPNGSATTLAKIRSMGEDVLSSLSQLQRNLGAHLDQAERELVQVRVETDQLRLTPASDLFVALERAVRDAAQSLGKRVELKTYGGETRINAHVLGEIRGALVHAVRNSVAHGIESESERRGAGKPPVGTIALSVERRGNQASFTCKDDGRGIDVEAVRRVVTDSSLMAPAEAALLSSEDLIRLALKEGLTTASRVTEVSGRGIGLDVVQEVTRRLKGAVALSSEKGQGTTLELCVPLSLSSLRALVTDVGGCEVCLPLEAVRGSIHLANNEIARSAENHSIVYEGRSVPFVPLARLLRRESLRKRSHWSVVMFQGGSDLLGLGVDRLLGISDVVVRPLPSWIAADSIVAGATLDRKGHPQLVLDPLAVLAAARNGRGSIVEAAVSRPPVLIIDDSLTTRMLEKSILESAGYQVELAISGEEGIAKARGHKYGVFVVDVEMPGIDGFEFLRQTQSDPMLRHVPSILVTSRNSPEDQLRGKELGAHAYIVKSEFDQGLFLKTLRDLIG